jgi:two-component system, NarL family, sensor histidine kinase DesK
VHVDNPQTREDTGWPKWAEFGGSDPEKGQPRRLRRIGWSAVWMVHLFGPILEIASGRFHGVEAIIAVLGLASFAALWLWLAWAGWRNFRSAQPHGLVLLGLLAVLSLVLLVAYGSNWLVLPFYLSAACAVVLPPRRTVPAITAATAVTVTACLSFHMDARITAIFGLQTFMIGLIVIGVRRMRALIAELREAREELARLAVNEERLRFARDLHDLLGHSLSLIVLKSTLARKLLDRNPTSAAAELADIESVGRQSLVDVRQAVSGYRDQSLAAELDRARSALSAAGIDATIHTVSTPLPAKVDALLSWAVREGVTNVLRHSHARRCEIAVRRDAQTAELEITDDGLALSSTAGEGTGSGLRGLAERMASAGGHLEAGPQPNGGFRLAVRLPTESPLTAAPAAARGDPGGRSRSPEKAVLDG